MAENTLRQRLSSGELVDLRTGTPENDDPAKADQWGAARQVPAELLLEVLTTPLEQAFPEGPVRRHLTLAGARVTGRLDLRAVSVPRSVLLRACSFEEPPSLRNTELLGLALPDCHLPGLYADGVRVANDMMLSDGFTATGEVGLLGAHIGGQLNCQGGTFRNPDGDAFAADNFTVGQSMHCDHGFTANGRMRLIGGRIGGQLNCQGGTFDNPGGTALSADGLTVGQSMYLSDGFTATGEIRLLGAHIDDQLSCTNGTFQNPGGSALVADVVTVGQNMYCNNGFTATGEVGLVGAHIGGQLNCQGGTFDNPGGTALSADRLTVEQSMYCSDGFAANGEIRLVGARVSGQLNCRDGTFHNPDGAALRLQRAEVGTDVLLEPSAFEGKLDLVLATVGSWVDNEIARNRPIELHGFRYTTIEPRELTTGARLDWLRRNVDDFDPQPYEQLAAVDAAAGKEDAARQVQVAKQWRRRARRRNPLHRWPSIAFSAFLRATVGYGYRPWLVLWWLFALLAGGTWLFGREHSAGNIVPATEVAAEQGTAGAGDQAFDAFRYSVDLLLPVIGLREDTAYAAVGDAVWYAFGFTCAGWLLALTLVAGLTGVFKRSHVG